MKLFKVYIKSHCEASDFEEEVEAENKEEAIEYFLGKINQGSEDPWSKDMIEPYVEEELE